MIYSNTQTWCYEKMIDDTFQQKKILTADGG